MREELEKRLFAIEPSFFNRTSMRESLMCFGFECGDGWYPLVDALIREAKHRRDNVRVNNEAYVEGSKFDADDPTTLMRRDPLPCLPDDRSGGLQDPTRVKREVYEGEFSGCPFTGDSRGIRNFKCVGGRVISNGPSDGPDYKGFGGPGAVEGEDLGECPGCEGTTRMVHYEHLCENAWNHFEVIQVKEKFGGLRFYVNAADDRYDGMVDFAEYMSTRTCEICGAWGTLEAKGWWNTLCDSCRSARNSGDKVLWEVIRDDSPTYPDWGKEEVDADEPGGH